MEVPARYLTEEGFLNKQGLEWLQATNQIHPTHPGCTFTLRVLAGDPDAHSKFLAEMDSGDYDYLYDDFPPCPYDAP